MTACYRSIYINGFLGTCAGWNMITFMHVCPLRHVIGEIGFVPGSTLCMRRIFMTTFDEYLNATKLVFTGLLRSHR